MKRFFLFIPIIIFLITSELTAQVNARLFRSPDVSETHITFTYAGDIWIVAKEGGTAHKLSSPKGEEFYPKFSPDGSQIAYTANYNGNRDVFVIPTEGGLPKRITYHGFHDRTLDWHPNGKEILFSSWRNTGRMRFGQLYTISIDGGLAKKLPPAYGEFASFSDDGKKIAFIDKTRAFRTWKRYRGGMASDIWYCNLEDLSSYRITTHKANDEFPMWKGDKVYFLSDRGEEMRFNLWSYDISSKELKQLTDFKDYDVHFPSHGLQDIVFEAGGKLYLYNYESGSYKEVEVKVVTDSYYQIPKTVKVEKYIQSMDISPSGKRAVVEARGEIFTVPAEHGYTMNLTQSSGQADRYPSWSPDGKKIAFWSDRSGEYELILFDAEKKTSKTLTSLGAGFRYKPFWSPDSKQIVFIDHVYTIWLLDVASGNLVKVDKANWIGHYGLSYFSVSWSPDSRWISYSRSLKNTNSAVFIFDTKEKKLHQATGEYYTYYGPTFGPEGNYLYVLTNQNFEPKYSDFNNTFIYPNATKIAVITLQKDVESPLKARNDEVEIKEEKSDDKKDKDKKDDKKDEAVKDVKIDFEGFESRTVFLPVKAGNYTNLRAVKGKVLYHKYPNTGSESKDKPLKYFDFKERKEKTILSTIDFYTLSADGEKILTYSKKKAAITKIGENQKIETYLNLGDMKAEISFKDEWKQLFTEAWRLQRDYFYDVNMHGVDWQKVKEQYELLLNDAVSRWDVNFVIGEMIAELNASHAYRGGGDTEKVTYESTGYLGIDWESANGYYRIKKIIKGAEWDTEVRSPFNEPGIDVKEGEYILAVNGIKLDSKKEPYHAFHGLGGKTVELLINSKPSMTDARKVIVKTLSSESRLRHLEWIETKRKRVEEATGGKIGYIYVRSTGIDGQNELIRQYMGQWHKEGLIIDERWNSGGQIPDRFIELLNKEPIAYWAVREADPWQWPTKGNFGPKIMLINGWSGSGGDAFPDYFKKAELGPLMGTRTWGGLIGITGAPTFIDGGGITVPTFRMYHPDGKWFREGHGVDPDIEVIEDHTELAKGIDNQLEKAIEWIKEELEKNPYKKPTHEPYETR